MYCGFENAIEIFDVNSPGATGDRIKTTPNRNSRDGQKGELEQSVGRFIAEGFAGIISTLAFSASRPGLFAAGSFDGTIGMFDASAGENTLLSLVASADSGGITQVSPPFSLLRYD